MGKKGGGIGKIIGYANPVTAGAQLLGGALGGQGFLGLGGTEGTQTTSSTYMPWNADKWSDVYGRSSNTMNQQLGTVNPNTQQSWDITKATAADPTNTQMLTGSKDYVNRLLSGEFLDPTKNLKLANQLQEGMADLGSWDQAAANAGRYGSDTWATGRGKELGNLRANLYGQGLNQMQWATGAAPGVYGAQYLPSQVYSALGKEQEQRPWDIYNQQARLLGMAQGGTTTNVSPSYTPSPMMGLIGLGASIAPMFAGAPPNIGGAMQGVNTMSGAPVSSYGQVPQIPSYSFGG